MFTERESWGVLYSVSVSAVATATAAALAVGLALEHDLWTGRPIRRGPARRRGNAAARHALPEASRFAREHFTLGTSRCNPASRC